MPCGFLAMTDQRIFQILALTRYDFMRQAWFRDIEVLSFELPFGHVSMLTFTQPEQVCRCCMLQSPPSVRVTTLKGELEMYFIKDSIQTAPEQDLLNIFIMDLKRHAISGHEQGDSNKLVKKGGAFVPLHDAGQHPHLEEEARVFLAGVEENDKFDFDALFRKEERPLPYPFCRWEPGLTRVMISKHQVVILRDPKDETLLKLIAKWLLIKTHGCTIAMIPRQHIDGYFQDEDSKIMSLGPLKCVQSCFGMYPRITHNLHVVAHAGKAQIKVGLPICIQYFHPYQHGDGDETPIDERGLHYRRTDKNYGQQVKSMQLLADYLSSISYGNRQAKIKESSTKSDEPKEGAGTQQYTPQDIK